MKKKVLLEGDSVSLFISFSKAGYFTSQDEMFSRYTFSGRMASQFSTGQVIDLDSVPMVLKKVWETEKKVILSFKLKDGPSDAVLFLKITDIKKDQLRLLELGQIFRKNTPDKIFLLKDSIDIPVTSDYSTPSGFKISSSVNTDSLPFKLYKISFPSAIGPHIIDNYELDSDGLEADSSGKLALDQIVKLKEGLAVFSYNSDIPGCFSYLFKEGSYPDLSKPSDLIEPLNYLTTVSEYQKLKSVSDEKIAVDSFWLSAGGSLEKSRQLIRNFYSRVVHANKLFTTYKEGWKTDKGMIFILFGRPDAVASYGEYEEWHYEKLSKKNFYTFIFHKKPLFLSNENYELVRSPEHKNVWQSQIEKWRKGIITRQ